MIWKIDLGLISFISVVKKALNQVFMPIFHCEKYPLYVFISSMCVLPVFLLCFSRWKLSQFRYLCQSNALPSHIKVNSKITKFQQINVVLYDLLYVFLCLIIMNIKVNSKITKFDVIELVYISLQFLLLCPPPSCPFPVSRYLRTLSTK